MQLSTSKLVVLIAALAATPGLGAPAAFDDASLSDRQSDICLDLCKNNPTYQDDCEKNCSEGASGNVAARAVIERDVPDESETDEQREEIELTEDTDEAEVDDEDDHEDDSALLVCRDECVAGCEQSGSDSEDCDTRCGGLERSDCDNVPGTSQTRRWNMGALWEAKDSE